MGSPTDTKKRDKELWRPLMKHKDEDGLLTTAGKCVVNNPVTGVPLDLLRGAAGAVAGGLNDVLPEAIKKHAPWDGTLEEKIDGKKDEQKSLASNLARYAAGLVSPLAAGDGTVRSGNGGGFLGSFDPLIAPVSRSKSKREDSKKTTKSSSFTPGSSPAGGGAGAGAGGTPLAGGGPGAGP